MTRTAAGVLQVARDLNIACPDVIEIRRIHSWPWQRGNGAWSWVAGAPGGITRFGSASSARGVIKAHKENRVSVLYGPWGAELIVDYPCVRRGKK